MSAPSPLVHYVDGTPQTPLSELTCRPAIVTDFLGHSLRPHDLTVFVTGGERYRSAIGYDSATYVPGTWHRLSDHEPAEQLRKTESSSAQLEGLAVTIVSQAWTHNEHLSGLHARIEALIGTARRSAPPNAIPGPEPSTDPLELAGRLMAIVTDAWLHATDRTLTQLHDEAAAVLTLAQRQQ